MIYDQSAVFFLFLYCIYDQFVFWIGKTLFRSKYTHIEFTCLYSMFVKLKQNKTLPIFAYFCPVLFFLMFLLKVWIFDLEHKIMRATLLMDSPWLLLNQFMVIPKVVFLLLNCIFGYFFRLRLIYGWRVGLQWLKQHVGREVSQCSHVHLIFIIDSMDCLDKHRLGRRKKFPLRIF